MTTPSLPSLVFPSKAVGEVIQLPFPFLNLIAWGETLTSASFTNAVYSGSDPSPSTMILNVTPGSPKSTLLLQVQGGVAGVVYLISCKVLGSSGSSYQQSGLLAVL